MRAALIAAFAVSGLLMLVVTAARESYPASGHFSAERMLHAYLSNSSSDLKRAPLTLLTYMSILYIVYYIV